MTQVVTNENMLEFIEKGKVAEFKAPEPADAKPEEKRETPPRDVNTGEFVKANGEKAPKEEKVEEKAAQPAGDEDPEDADLPERVRKQIGKKHRAMKEAEEFAADAYRKRLSAEERAEQLEREIAELKKSGAGPTTSKDVDPDEPKMEDFKTVGDYTRALTKYEVAKAKREALANQEQAKQQTYAETRSEAFGKRQEDYIKANPDYLSVVDDADFDVPTVALQYTIDSEYGPQLIHHLAKHPEIAERLRSLSPPRIIAELGKLEILFEKKPEPQEKPAPATREVSRAPAPITPIEGKSTPVVSDPSKMSFKELREYERNREAQRRGAR